MYTMLWMSSALCGGRRGGHGAPVPALRWWSCIRVYAVRQGPRTTSLVGSTSPSASYYLWYLKFSVVVSICVYLLGIVGLFTHESSPGRMFVETVGGLMALNGRTGFDTSTLTV
jgi:hypothetical protein